MGGGFSAPDQFDLGNAWLRAGHPGWAALQYERGLVLAPRDPALLQALAAAQARAGVGVAPQPLWSRAVGTFTDDAWAWILLAALIILCLGLAPLGLGRARRLARLLVVLGCCGTALALDAIALRWPELDQAVVVAGHAAAQLAPAPAAEPTFDLREGQIVYLRDRFKDYLRVATPDGRSGWVSDQEVRPVRVTVAEAAAEARPHG